MDEREKTLQQAKLDAGNIKMMVSDPTLKNRIKSNITDPDGSVYWYIRFNTLLDPDSVTKYTMNVTDTKGYILNIIITYDDARNLIVLNPMDLYRQNEYYILNISKKVRSNKGRPLKKPVYIMFKLIDDMISEFKVIKDTASVPKARKKPVNVRRAELMELMTQTAYEPNPQVGKLSAKPTLPYGNIAVKVQLAILGLIWLILSFFFANFYVTLAGVSLLIMGLLHIAIQLFKPTVRAAICYDLGVRRFNRGNYAAALGHFERSQELDERNIMTQYALRKVQMFV